jgi:hypothetical protein
MHFLSSLKIYFVKQCLILLEREAPADLGLTNPGGSATASGSAIQRNGRIQRASSTWPSIVIQDLLIAGSIEERQHEALQQKTAIANAIIDGEGIDEDGGIAMTTGSLKQFLEATIV